MTLGRLLGRLLGLLLVGLSVAGCRGLQDESRPDAVSAVPS